MEALVSSPLNGMQQQSRDWWREMGRWCTCDHDRDNIWYTGEWCVASHSSHVTILKPLWLRFLLVIKSESFSRKLFVITDHGVQSNCDKGETLWWTTLMAKSPGNIQYNHSHKQGFFFFYLYFFIYTSFFSHFKNIIAGCNTCCQWRFSLT